MSATHASGHQASLGVPILAISVSDRSASSGLQYLQFFQCHGDARITLTGVDASLNVYVGIPKTVRSFGLQTGTPHSAVH